MRSLATATIDGATYLFAAGRDDSGISVFSVAPTGALTHVQSIADNPTLHLDAASAVATAVVGSKTYLFAGGASGVSVSPRSRQGSP